MTRKKSPRKPVSKTSSRRGKKRGKKNRFLKKSSRSSKTILGLLLSHQEPVSLNTIMAGLHFPAHDKKLVKQKLTTLIKSGRVVREGTKFMLRPAADLVEAVLSLTAKGFGFAVREGHEGKDVFIAPKNLNGASHDDRILIKITPGRRGKPEATVVRVLKRSTTRIAGIYSTDKKRKAGYVIPDNDKLPYQVQISRSNSMGAKDSSAVLVKIIDFGSGRRNPEGKVISILGPPDSVEVQLKMSMIKHDLPSVFPSDVMQEIADLQPVTSCDAHREDLRQIDHVTIDGETAKDFDDAIYAEKIDKGFRLYVSIADVGNYVKPGSAIDREAYLRGTSVYMPGRVIPMLPERLSNDLCSLVPNQDRPAFTAVLDFDAKGTRTGMRFTKSLIRSCNRFTYTQVQHILFDNDPEQRQQWKKSLTMLETADKLTKLLHARREERGSLGFIIPQADIRLDEDDKSIIDIGHQQRNPAHLLIEECMLAANEAVAEFLSEKKQDVLYRVHEDPDPTKVDALVKAASSMGLELPQPVENSPAWFARVLEKAAAGPSAYILNNLLLRTMQRARYSPENLGHFGLAAEYYTHFTSPIRRYPDLIAHRALFSFLNQNAEKTLVKTNLDEASTHLSSRERVAVDVERDVHARLSVLFMKDKVGDEFEAIISGVSSFGFFIELADLYISGAVPVKDMRDDYYFYDAESHRLTGETSGKIYQIGNRITVRLVRVDSVKKQLTFTCVSPS